MRSFTWSTLVYAIFATLLHANNNALAQSEGDNLEAAQQQLKELMADVTKPREEFDTLYEGKLKELENKAAEAGNLDLVVVVQKEAKEFRSRTQTAPK